MPKSEFLDVVAFLRVGRDQNIRPRKVGYAKRDDKDPNVVHVTLLLIPVQGAGWDGSLKIEPQQVREDDDRDDPRSDDPRSDDRRNRSNQRDTRDTRGGRR